MFFNIKIKVIKINIHKNLNHLINQRGKIYLFNQNSIFLFIYFFFDIMKENRFFFKRKIIII